MEVILAGTADSFHGNDITMENSMRVLFYNTNNYICRTALKCTTDTKRRSQHQSDCPFSPDTALAEVMHQCTHTYSILEHEMLVSMLHTEACPLILKPVSSMSTWNSYVICYTKQVKQQLHKTCMAWLHAKQHSLERDAAQSSLT